MWYKRAYLGGANGWSMSIPFVPRRVSWRYWSRLVAFNWVLVMAAGIALSSSPLCIIGYWLDWPFFAVRGDPVVRFLMMLAWWLVPAWALAWVVDGLQVWYYSDSG